MTKIAIIEDDTVISQMYRMKFELEGFQTEVAQNGEDGVEMVQKFAPDLILLDLQMPEMTGDEALVKIRSQKWGKNIPVLILTNTGKEEAPSILDTLNVSSYIVKAEMTPKQVVQKANEILEKQ